MGKKDSEKDVQERLSSKQKDTFQFGFVLNLSNNGQTSLTELSLPKLSGTVCWCPAEEESGRNGWWRVVTYQLLLKSVNWQMKPSDLWAISETKQKKIRTTIWEVGRRYLLAKMFHKTWANTETHTNTLMCTHTYTYRKAMPSEKPAISPYYWDFFPQLPNMKRELGDLLQRVSRWQKNWILLEVPLLTHYLTSSKPPVMNVGHSLSICKAGVSILTFCKPCSACKWGFQRTLLFWE